MKGGRRACAGGVCSAATSLNLLCIAEGCCAYVGLVHARLHMCYLRVCKASSAYLTEGNAGGESLGAKVVENFTILVNFPPNFS